MEKRIEQLVDEGFTLEQATAIAANEGKKVQALLAEGFARDRAVARAQREARMEILTAEKRQAGLTPEQARSVAAEQLANDARVAAVGLASKNTAVKAEWQAAAKKNAAVAAAFLEDVAPVAAVEEKAKG